MRGKTMLAVKVAIGTSILLIALAVDGAIVAFIINNILDAGRLNIFHGITLIALTHGIINGGFASALANRTAKPVVPKVENSLKGRLTNAVKNSRL